MWNALLVVIYHSTNFAYYISQYYLCLLPCPCYVWTVYLMVIYHSPALSVLYVVIYRSDTCAHCLLCVIYGYIWLYINVLHVCIALSVLYVVTYRQVRFQMTNQFVVISLFNG